MAKIQGEFIQYYSRWPKMLSSLPWEANMGFTMRGVSKRPSPIIRSQAFPNAMSALPKKDVVEVREVTEDTILYRQDFESNLMHFLPNFVDFLTDHVDKTNEDLVEKVMVYADQFYRTAIFHASPKVWICGKDAPLTLTPYWSSPNIAEAKSQAVLTNLIAQCSEMLTAETLSKISTMMYTDEAVVPFSGKVLGDGTNGEQLKHKYCLLTATEVWDDIVHQQFIQSNRPLAMNIITDGFFGPLFGRWTTMFERYELRIADDGTIPAPETIEEGPNAYNRGEPIPNPAYVNARFGVAFGCGAPGYRNIRIGPPPKEWTGMTMKEFSRLDWNGKVDVTKNVMIPCLNAAGETVLDTNKRGEYIQLISSIALGISPVRRRNVIPIIYKRARVEG